MLVMIPLTLDEVVAMIQFVARQVRAGESFWRTFWVGGTLEAEGKDSRTPAYGAPAGRFAPAMFWGVTVPWNLAAGAAMGLWLMAAPSVLGAGGRAADSDRIAGALAVTAAVIAMAEVTRAARFANVLLGAWTAAAPWLLEGASAAGRWNGLVADVLMAGLAFRRGRVSEKYGSWDRRIV